MPSGPYPLSQTETFLLSEGTQLHCIAAFLPVLPQVTHTRTCVDSYLALRGMLSILLVTWCSLQCAALH